MGHLIEDFRTAYGDLCESLNALAETEGVFVKEARHRASRISEAVEVRGVAAPLQVAAIEELGRMAQSLLESQARRAETSKAGQALAPFIPDEPKPRKIPRASFGSWDLRSVRFI